MSVGERTTPDAKANTVDALPAGEPVAWLFPGLGSRFVGMGADIIAEFSAADRLIARAARKLGYDIREVCLSGSGRKYVAPRIEAQVIYVINCAYVDVLHSFGQKPHVVCGHSLGSWSAAYAAGVLDFDSGLEMVTAVEDQLDQHIHDGEQAMGVVIGLDETFVAQMCGEEEDVYLANLNSPGQYVIAGRATSVDAVLERASELGAKKSQQIAGSRAMHTPLLARANREILHKLSAIHFDDPTVPLLNCFSLQPMMTSDEIRGYFGEFLQQPVRWEASMRKLGALGTYRYLEVGAAALLTGMMPFIDRAAHMETVSDWLARHATANATDLTSPV